MKYLKNFENHSQPDFLKQSPLAKLTENQDLELISKVLDYKSSGKLLEIACGNGADAVEFKKNGFDVTCIDNNPKYCEIVNNNKIKAFVHDIQNKLPFDNESFDVIYSRLGLHYFSEDKLNEIFNDIYRICKKDSVFVFSVKVDTDAINSKKIILGKDKWTSLAEKCGFLILSSEIKDGMLYGSPSKWVEIISKK